MTRLILFNKPYGVLCQFTDGSARLARPTLSDFIDMPGVYPAGRLDLDSEGLLLLTNDGRLQARIADPRFKMPKSYLVQVEGDAQEASLDRLRRGVRLKDGLTLPAEVERITAPALWPRDPPRPFSQERSRLLAQADDKRRPEPAGTEDDGRHWPSDVEAAAMEHRRLDD